MKHLRKIILVITLLGVVCRLAAAAPSKVDVRVFVNSKESGEALAGVVVGFPDCGIYAASETDGGAVLKGVPEGRWKFSAQMIGMLDYEVEVKVSAGMSPVNVLMVESSFRLDDVVVTARSGAVGASTASSISRTAIDHLQATSLSDIMELLPGQLSSNPSLTSASKATIRQVGTDAMNSLGTSIIVNGAPVSNNANLQVGNTATSGTLTSGYSSTAGSGVDLRQISVDNVESVDVIRGIPSVEYGDLTSGVIIVNPKAGEYPFRIRTKINPTLTQASVSKGFALGKKGGALSADFDYASSLADERRPYQQYRRITANLLYSKTFAEKLRTTTGFGFYSDLDAQKLDPTDVKYQRKRSAENMGFKFNTNINWQADLSFLKSLKFNLSANYAEQTGYTQEIKGNFGYMVTSAMTDGTVAANVGGPVYDNLGNKLTNTDAPGHEASTNILPYEFLTQMTTYGKPINVFAKVVASMFTEFWGIGNRIIGGAEWKTDVNFGQGKVFDPLMPPSSGLRMRPYTDIPALNQFSLYAEDNISKTLWNRDLKVQLGLRFDLVQPGRSEMMNALSPRVNASFEIVPKMLKLRGGWGITAKAPPLVYLYPEKAYFDFVNYINFGVDSNGWHFSTKSTMELGLEADGNVIIKGAQGISGTPKDANFTVGVILVLLTLFIVQNLIKSRDGRAIMAIRDNRIAAESVGINITKYKLMVFTISASLAGAAGALYSHNYATLTPAGDKFNYNASIMILVYVVLGGIGNIRGSVIAAILLYILPEKLRFIGDYRMLVYAIVLIIVMLMNWAPKAQEYKQMIAYKFKSKFGKNKEEAAK